MRFEDPNIQRKDKLQSEHLRRAAKLPGGQPTFSHVEFSICGLCNRTCEFCPRADPKVYPNVKEYISIDLYTKILTELSAEGYSGGISYSGFSEPFYHKRLVKMVSLTREYLPDSRIEIVTNGDMLKPKKVRALYDAGLSRMLVSMYDSALQIDILSDIRDKAGVPEDWMILRKRYLQAGDSFGINLTNRAGMVSGMEELGVGAVAEPLKHACYYTHYRMMVDHTGEVLLCPHDWGKRLIAGNLNQENIFDIWTRGLAGARKALAVGDRSFAPCNACDVEGTLQGGDHFAAWQKYAGDKKSDLESSST